MAPGIVVRHSRRCRSREGGTCNCEPTYEPWVYSARDKKKIRPRQQFQTLAAARSWRTDALKAVKEKRLRAPSLRFAGTPISSLSRRQVLGLGGLARLIRVHPGRRLRQEIVPDLARF